ncbi:hypothetical protein BGX21_008762 [Mortierella sp. AD011]|nr:hypothetical protein BGX20_008342 [Mortierella sp. AD010]KAF9402778.1 hypothetical protein BGX21_008762 [Mortierella sp. AD011]
MFSFSKKPANPQQTQKTRWSAATAGTSSVPTPQGPSRANDEQFQQIRSTYLSNFNFRGIHVTATPLLPSVLRGVTTELPVLFQIKVGQRSKQAESEFSRTPFNACLVLDISGSMSGQRLDSCKKAINAIIHSLTPHDTVSLVTYSSSAKTVFVDCNHTHKEMMLKSVARINTEGNTNLHEGLQLGVQSLRQSMKKEAPAILKRNAHRVFLFSDGLVNGGITDQATIEAHVKEWIENDISISTFGIGDGYDEKLMKAIADAANGDSFFIETEADIEDSVAKGLRGVSSIIAPAATLKVRGLGDAVVKDIPGYVQTTPGQITTKSLRTNGVIQLVVNLDIRVPGLEDFSENDMDDVVDSKKILGYSLTLEGEHYADPEDCQGMTGTITVNYTTNVAMVADDKKDSDVVSFLTIKEAAKIDLEAMEHLANNRTQEALEAKRKVISMYEAVAPIDRYGFSKAMQNQSERLVKNVETSGNTRFAQKMWVQQQREAEDDDMGFGLFD